MKNKCRNFIAEEYGTTSVEYAVMLALIASGIIAAIIAVGGGASAFWNGSSDALGDSLNANN